MEKTPTVWILSDGKAGTEGQAIGLAQALNLKYEVFRLKGKFPWKYIPSFLWINPLKHINLKLPSTIPPIVIAAGRITAAPAAALKKLGTFTIFIQNPYMATSNFDVVICPEHDHLKRNNVIETIGSLHRLTPSSLNAAKEKFNTLFAPLPHPRFTVLIGGNNRHVTFSDAFIDTLISNLKNILKASQGSLLMTASRRTPNTYVEKLKTAFKDSPCYFWPHTGKNPYQGLLAHGDYIIVTGDSVSMASEAAFTGKPVYIAEIPGNSPKFQEFHQSLYKNHHAKPLTSVVTPWVSSKLDDTARITKILQTTYLKNFQWINDDLLKKR